MQAGHRLEERGPVPREQATTDTSGGHPREGLGAVIRREDVGLVGQEHEVGQVRVVDGREIGVRVAAFGRCAHGIPNVHYW